MHPTVRIGSVLLLGGPLVAITGCAGSPGGEQRRATCPADGYFERQRTRTRSSNT